MLVTLSGITISVNNEQPEKAEPPILSIPPPSVTLVRLVQLLNAQLPMLVTLSPIIKVCIDVWLNSLPIVLWLTLNVSIGQFSKAQLPMLSNPLPSVTLARLVQPLKAEFPMLVTLSGITISVNAVQSLKALPPMLSNPLPKVTLARLVQL